MVPDCVGETAHPREMDVVVDVQLVRECLSVGMDACGTGGYHGEAAGSAASKPVEVGGGEKAVLEWRASFGAFVSACTVRGIEVGNREQFEDMSRAIEMHDIKPVLDARKFPLMELKDAFNLLWSQSHFGKVVLTDMV
ncbi:hypothetical protein MW887_006646 [Aspergillus wentii]|nr:hypothetical protein MW887_006646 [Aspergillus wentii]